MILLITPVRTEVVQVKTSLFLSKSDNNSASSSDERSCAISTNLYGTLGSSRTCFVLHLASIAILPLLQALPFGVQVFCWPLTSTSLKKCAFLWLRANPYSIFLASFCLL
jgi:hypothetical protein